MGYTMRAARWMLLVCVFGIVGMMHCAAARAASLGSPSGLFVVSDAADAVRVSREQRSDIVAKEGLPPEPVDYVVDRQAFVDLGEAGYAIPTVSSVGWEPGARPNYRWEADESRRCGVHILMPADAIRHRRRPA